MKLTISERIHKSNVKPEWDMDYWVVYIIDYKKLVYTKHWNKMFDIKPFFESLIKSYPIHEVNVLHRMPPHIDVFDVNASFVYWKKKPFRTFTKNGL